MSNPFNIHTEPTKKGWYIVRYRDEPDRVFIRAWGNGMWWTDLGRGNGKDGWMGSAGRNYEWLGPCGDVMKDAPNYPQAVRNLPEDQRNALMEYAADVCKTLYVGHREGMETP
jgi:hypothetical protein